MGSRIHGSEPLLAHVCVALRGGDIGVPEQFLDDPEVGTAVEQVGGEAVPEGVRMGRVDRTSIE
jgi:hypothetical protein